MKYFGVEAIFNQGQISQLQYLVAVSIGIERPVSEYQAIDLLVVCIRSECCRVHSIIDRIVEQGRVVAHFGVAVEEMPKRVRLVLEMAIGNKPFLYRNIVAANILEVRKISSR